MQALHEGAAGVVADGGKGEGEGGDEAAVEAQQAQALLQDLRLWSRVAVTVMLMLMLMPRVMVTVMVEIVALWPFRQMWLWMAAAAVVVG